MTTLKFIINNRIKKNGKHAVYLRITHDRVPTTIETGIDVFENEWQNDTGRIRKVKNGSENIGKLNSKLNKLFFKVENLINKFDDEEKLHDISVSQLRAMILNKKNKLNLFEFWEGLINGGKHFKSLCSKKGHENSLRSFKLFSNDVKLEFKDVNYEFLKNYEKWNLRKGNTYNGFSTNLNLLKSVFNEAIKREIIPHDNYPFRTYKVKKTETKKRALTIDELNKLVNINLKDQPKLERARNLFLISYYMGGVPFIDLAKLKIKNFKNGLVCYSRSKTKVKIETPVNDKLHALLKPYLEGKDSGYVFNFITNDDLFKSQLEYNRAWSNYYFSLKKLGKKCGIKATLTTYVPRHTFATLALNEYKMPLNLVKSTMGHKKISTTQTYIDVYKNSDKVNYFNVL